MQPERRELRVRLVLKVQWDPQVQLDPQAQLAPPVRRVRMEPTAGLVLKGQPEQLVLLVPQVRTELTALSDRRVWLGPAVQLVPQVRLVPQA